MRIAVMCNSPDWGGLEINMVRLATWLNESNDVTLIVAKGTTAHAEASATGADTIIFESKRNYGDVKAIMKMADLLRHNKFGALIVGHSKDIHVVALAKIFSRAGTKLVYQQHMALGVDKSDPLHTFFYHQLHAWISPLQSHAEIVKKRTNIAHRKVHVVPLGLDFDGIQNKEVNKNEARKTLDLPIDAFIIGIVGRPDPGKGMEYFIRSFTEIKARGMEVQGLMLGLINDTEPSNHALAFIALIKELGLEDIISIRPFRKDVETAYAAMDVFVMASLSETYGMVTLEAMAAGVPVVATTTVGPSGILKNGQYGLMIPPADPKALAEAVLRYKNEPQLAEEMSEKAKKAVLKDYDRRQECRQILEIINS